MEIADTDRDGVLTFEEFMHAHAELQKRAGRGGDDNKQDGGSEEEVDDLPPGY